MNNQRLELVADFYEYTMANGYFNKNMEDRVAYFDVFFRKVPDEGGYAIVAGLEQIINYIRNVSFDEEDISYLRKQNKFTEEFLNYLENFRFTGDIWAIPEGTVVFPNEPLITVKAPIIQAQLLETMLLLTTNHQSLIATKTSRIVKEAQGRPVMEFGARRAHGINAAVEGARAAIIGGAVGTSCTLSAKEFNVPASGTMAHSWIQSFDSEYEAFKAYAELYPDDCTFLIDTYNTIESGLPNAIKVFNEVLKPKGYRPKAVRLDSGDLAYLSKEARKPLIRGIGLDKACQMPLNDLVEWVRGIPNSMPDEMKPMACEICDSFLDVSKRLLDLGLGYLSLDRAASTLSTGERQRMQLARAVRNRTTGILYVLDEPSIGLHPSNIYGLIEVMNDLIHDGNSILLVDHDTEIIKEANWLIEMGPEAGKNGGYVFTEGTIEQIKNDKKSMIGPFLTNHYDEKMRPISPIEQLFEFGKIHLSTNQIHTVHPLEVDIPKGKLTVVTGVSGSGKTTMILESLLPAIQTKINDSSLPDHVKDVQMEGIEHIKLIDASPIGINIRSTVATYINVHDELRKRFAKTESAKSKGYKAGDFSYNTGKLRCPTCDGTGTLSLDVQFLPDVHVTCPDCHGSRYNKESYFIKYKTSKEKEYSLPELMEMDVSFAKEACQGLKGVYRKLEVLENLGLGYLTLGEETPSLSGGEAQRLKLASEMSKSQNDSIFIFDEPTIGLHPLDVQILVKVFQSLVDQGATVVVIEHDRDVIKNADYIIDMGPGGGQDGGMIVATGSVEEIKNNIKSITGKYL